MQLVSIERTPTDHETNWNRRYERASAVLARANNNKRKFATFQQLLTSKRSVSRGEIFWLKKKSLGLFGNEQEVEEAKKKRRYSFREHLKVVHHFTITQAKTKSSPGRIWKCLSRSWMCQWIQRWSREKSRERERELKKTTSWYQ